MAHQGRRVRVGADIGGTFTDIVVEVGSALHSTKLLTTHTAPEQAIVEGIGLVLRQAGIAAGEIDSIIHGTTLATNALIERRGARTALITTSGFRDVIEMRTENRFELYDLNIVLPAPLVPREDRFVIGERVDSRGGVLKAIDQRELAGLVEQIIAAGYQSVAVGLIHSYANASHERQIKAELNRQRPDLPVSISSEVSPQMREFQRFNTVCANAYVQPVMAAYLRRLVGSLAGIGIGCPVYIMHSGGGIISVDSAIAFPVRLLESGPAGGAIFAASIAGRYRLRSGALLRHGRHDRENLPDREADAKDRQDLRGGAYLPLQEGQRHADFDSGGRDGRDRCWRRFDRQCRQLAADPCRSAEFRLRTGPRLLRSRRQGANRDGCRPAARPHRSRRICRRHHQAVHRCCRDRGQRRAGTAPLDQRNKRRLWHLRGGRREHVECRPHACRRERQGTRRLHDDCLRRRSAAACRAALRKTRHRHCPGAAGRRRRFGDRVPARAIRL